MKTKGVIKSINNERGFGEIISDDVGTVNFELFECDYDYVKVNDSVIYDLVKLADGKFEALNVNFLSNPILSELNRSFEKQQKLYYNVIKPVSRGYILNYKGVNVFFPSKDGQAHNLTIGDTVELFILHFKNNGEMIIVSSNKNRNTNLFKKYKNLVNKEDSFEFEVCSINDYGLIVNENDNLGFIPNTHIIPFEKKNIKIGQILKTKVIGCSMRNGLVLSIRNHELYGVLQELKTAHQESLSLTGKMIKSNSHLFFVEYEGINLHLNRSFIQDDLNNCIKLNDLIEFKVIDFSWNKEISISNKEIENYKLLEMVQNENMFKGQIVEVLETGVMVSINKLYSGYMPFNEMSDNWKVDFNVLKKGSIIKASVNNFDFNGILLSRIKYLNKAKKKIASKTLSVGHKMSLKIYERMAFFGVLVKNHRVKGLISMDDIIPPELRENLDRKKFKYHCSDIFKRRAWLKCVVSDIDIENNKVYFELDYEDTKNQERIKIIANYFDDTEMILEFHNEKTKLQFSQTNLHKLKRI